MKKTPYIKRYYGTETKLGETALNAVKLGAKALKEIATGVKPAPSVVIPETPLVVVPPRPTVLTPQNAIPSPYTYARWNKLTDKIIPKKVGYEMSKWQMGHQLVSVIPVSMDTDDRILLSYVPLTSKDGIGIGVKYVNDKGEAQYIQINHKGFYIHLTGPNVVPNHTYATRGFSGATSENVNLDLRFALNTIGIIDRQEEFEALIKYYVHNHQDPKIAQLFREKQDFNNNLLAQLENIEPCKKILNKLENKEMIELNGEMFKHHKEEMQYILKALYSHLMQDHMRLTPTTQVEVKKVLTGTMLNQKNVDGDEALKGILDYLHAKHNPDNF